METQKSNEDSEQFVPKPLSPRHTVLMTLKILGILGVLLALLWCVGQGQAAN